VAGAPFVNRDGGAGARDPAPANRGRAAHARRVTVGALVATLLVALAAPAAMAQRMLVVAPTDSPAYRQALAGIQRQAGRLGIEVRHVATDNVDELNRVLAGAGRGTALIALGPRASDAVARSGTAAPVVGCIVPIGATPGPSPAAIVSADVPIDVQIGWLRRLLPAGGKVGLLYDPALNGRRVDLLAFALEAAGYTAVRVPVASPAALPAALGSLAGSVDVILGLPDTTVYTQQTVKALLLHSFRHKIPLVGLSDAWVKAGALLGFDWDYDELGGHCATLAARQIVASRAPAPTVPPRPRVAINLRTAAQFNLNWDPDLVRGVDRTFE
jgi:putative ABC transport system substrate-binding protein